MSAPLLEPRRSDEFVASLHERIPAYVPTWRPQEGAAGDALLRIYARFLEALGDRINRAPEKNELAFLDLLGLDLLPAQAARAPVVFTTMPQLGDSRAIAGTRLTAKPQGAGDQVVFETETSVALAAARIAEIVTVWPGKDAYANHSGDALGGRPFALWQPLQPIRHELYLAHPVQLALAGRAFVELDVELGTEGSAPLALSWQYWDGGLWRDFAALAAGDDGTEGLTRTGAIALHADCARSKPTTVAGVTSSWIRGSLAGPLPPDDSRTLPQVDRITLRTVLEQQAGADCKTGLLPDAAFAGAMKIDATKPFQPLGPAPASDAAFYVACAEAFSRPGAEVTICLDRPKTAQEVADEEGDAYAAEITVIIGIMLAVAQFAASELQEIGTSVISLADPAGANAIRLQGKIDAVGSAAAALTDLSGLDALARTARELAATIGSVPVDVVKVTASVPDVGRMQTELNTMRDQAKHAADRAAWLASWADSILTGLTTILGGTVGVLASSGDRQHQAGEIADDVGKMVAAFAVAGTAKSTLEQRVNALNDALGGVLGALGVPDATGNVANAIRIPVDILWKNDSVVDENASRRRIQASDAASVRAADDGSKAFRELAKLSPFDVGSAVGVNAPALDPPALAWEYWSAGEWRALPVNASAAGVDALMLSGTLKFTVPPDWDETSVAGTAGLWLRARVSGGTYGKLRLVTWVDTQTKRLMVLPVITPRPPEVKALRIGYVWKSDPTPVERCLTLNDFQWFDRTEEATSRGTAFAPFASTLDLVPTLYLGFDGALPEDVLGLFLDVDELADGAVAPPLEWQYWDGSTWGRVTVEDETGDLARPGIVRVLWPGADSPPTFPLVDGAGAALVLESARVAAAFEPGDLLWVSDGAQGELVTVAEVAADRISLRAPLAGSYARGSVGRAGLPRFGVPRTWLRARLRVDGDPLRAAVNGVFVNAVWAAQIQTVSDELLGSSNGQPRQTFFFARTPVLRGETIEVRELEGPRAAVDYPLLVAELAHDGIREADIRAVVDPRTRKIVEVWVPWRLQPNLLFSEPGDRHYSIERSHGRLIFGDGENGRIPAAGANAVRARRYRSGGGSAGNVPAGAITHAVSGVVVQGVSNPRPAQGGADGEADRAVLRRGPLTLRNWRQALSADDYVALAHEASPAVALARTLPATGPRGRYAPGFVTVLVVPHSPDPEPQPSFELRREVHDFLEARSPAALAGRLRVIGPSYQRVGADAVVAPRTLDEGAAVAAEVRAALLRFLHPLTGGPDGAGWGARSEVCLSDIAALLEPLDGVDYVESLQLVDRGLPTNDVLPITESRLVSAGPIRIRLTGAGA